MITWRRIFEIGSTNISKIIVFLVISTNILTCLSTFIDSFSFNNQVWAYFIGSLLFLTGYSFYLLFCPDIIKNYKNKEDFLESVKKNIAFIDWELEFVESTKKKLNNKNSYYKKILQLGDFDKAIEAGLDKHIILGYYCFSEYNLLNQKHLILILVITVLMFIGLIMIQLPLIIKIIKILIGVI